MQPTVADVISMDPSRRIDVGGWTDRDTKARMAMPNRYSDARLFSQAATKHEIIAGARQAITKLGTQNCQWEELANVWPAHVPVIQAEKANSIPTFLKPLSLPEHEKQDATSSSSASSSSDTDEDPDGEKDAILANLPWCVSQGARGHLHLVDCEKLACGRKLSRPESGFGISQALTSNRQWSPRCFAALPQCAQEWWHDAQRVSI